jgi:hypothetical protein
MFLGLNIIAAWIVPMQIPGLENKYIINILQVVTSASLVIIWFLIWRWLAQSIFWRNILSNEKRLSRTRVKE